MNIGNSNRSRLLQYLFVTGGAAFLAYVCRTGVSMLLARDSMRLSMLIMPVSYVINVLAAVLAASLNRRKTFCSQLSWWVAVPVMVVLEMLFRVLGSFAWRSVMETVITAVPAQQVGSCLQAASVAINLLQFALWATLSYLFQRFVLYRDTLDTIGN